MGIKAHVAKTYRIEYEPEHLNHCRPVVNRLLYAGCGGFSFSGEDVETAEHIEVSREDLRDAIEVFKSHPNIIGDLLNKHAVNKSHTPNDIIECLESWLTSSDQTNSYIVVDWF